jgi:Family of unknown function (DUF6600)
MIKSLQTVNENLMKNNLKIFGIAFLVMLFSAIRVPASAQEPSVTYQTFYDDLSPYGDWIDYPEYGYVWHPRIVDFRPYSTGGHWVWTDEYQWMWVSDYNWGWAPFHYGRWLYDDFYGWVWMPGYEWSPAWVEWRTGGDYYGWAPLGPGVNISLNFSFGRYSPPYDYWSFVPRNYILSPRVYDYCVPRSRNTVIINNTTIINNYNRTNNVFVTGPQKQEVERYTGRINAFALRDSRGPGRTEVRRNAVTVFRPQVQQANSDRGFAPRNFERYDKQNGNVFQQRNQEIVNNERRNDVGRRADQNNGRIEQRNSDNNDFVRRQAEMRRLQDARQQQQQRNNEQRQNQFERRDQEVNRQNDVRRQQEQRAIEQQQQQNRNAFERRQNEMRQQQEVQKQEQRNFDRRQNEMRQYENQRMQQMRQQQQQQQQQEQRRQWNTQRQNNGSERRQFAQPNQQQRENAFQQRGSQDNGRGNGNGNGRGRGHGHD